MISLDTVVGQGLAIINKIIPDPVQREQAKLALLQAQQNGDLEEIRVALSAIIAEAQSNDKWTSRARPSFLYVMYVMILSAFPMGVVAVISPETAAELTKGVRLWLESVPGELWALFGTGYLGYVKKRSDDKAIAIGQPVKKVLGIF